VSKLTQKADILRKILDKLDVPYADASYMENHTRRLSKDASDIDFSVQADAGVKIRAYDGKRFHETCIQGWQPAVINAHVQRLATYLKENPPEGKLTALKIPKNKLADELAVTPIQDPSKVSIEEKTAFVTKLHEHIMGKSKQFVNCQVTYREEEEHRVFVNPYKELSSTWTGCTVSVMPFVQTSSGQTRSDFFTNFANGYEVTEIDQDELTTFLDRTVKIKTAKKITPGTYTVVLSPTVTGLLAHESFGHGMEADTILHGRARAAEYIGKKIASVKVNICEDASLPSTHGFLFFDDEGEKPKRIYLVERGIVQQPISDAYSATYGNIPKTANGKAEAFDHKIYARMTNTFFEPGKDDPKKMIKDVKNGLYVHSGSSGMEDPKGWGVQIAGLLCERIKNGKLTGELFYEASMGGYLPNILGNIKAIGKDFEIIKDVGFCGKHHKEWVRVSSGGPHLLIEGVELS